MATKVANLRGATGAKGSTGATGNTGATGSQGQTGNQGPVGNPGPTVVSSDSGNQAILGSDSLIFVPVAGSIPLADTTQSGLLRQVSGTVTDIVDGTNHIQAIATAVNPTIWIARQNAYNALGNPNFEVDARTCGNGSGSMVGTAGFGCDRWKVTTGAGISASAKRLGYSPLDGNTGSTYHSGPNALQVTTATQKATLVATDYLGVLQYVEGPFFLPLYGNYHSIQFGIQSNAPAPHKIGIGIRCTSGSTNYSWGHLCQLSGQSVVDLIKIPNISPVPSGVSTQPGVIGYQFWFTLAAGSNYIPASNDSWISGGTTIGALGQDNFLANASGTTINILYVQHEPGPYCTYWNAPLFPDNYLSCQRYYTKSNAYTVQFPSASDWRAIGFVGSSSNGIQSAIRWPVTLATDTPTVLFSDNVGATNKAYLDTVGSVALTTGTGQVSYLDSAGVGQVNMATAAAAWSGVLGQWQADTGW